MKRLKTITFSVLITGFVAIAVFIAVNIEPVLDNAFTLLSIYDDKNRIKNGHSPYVDCGNFNFTFEATIDGHLLTAGYSPSTGGPIVLSAIRKHAHVGSASHFVSDYGYAVVTDLGKAYVLIENDKQEKLDDFDNIIYLSSFDEFAPEWQEQLKYLDEKIIFSY